MRKSRIYLFFAVASTFLGCVPSDGAEEFDLNDNQNNLIDGWALTYYENTKIPYTFVNNNNEKSAALDNDVNGELDGFYINSGDESVLLSIDESTLLPTRLTLSSGEIVLFNYKDNFNKLDLALINSDESINYVRDIEIDPLNHTFNSISSKRIKANISSNIQGDTDKIIEGFLLAGKVISFAASKVGCIVSVSAAIASGGIAIPVAALSCTSFAVSSLDLTATLINESGTDIDSGIFTGISLLSLNFDFAGCVTGDPVACATAAFTVFDNSIKALTGIDDDKIEVINLANGALISGFGQVKITLTWNSVADVDLWVTEPNGNRIDYNNPVSSTGGFLDFDDVDGFGPENIFWKENAPIGLYIVQVNNFESNGAALTSYSVQLEVQGSVAVYNGTLVAENQVNDIAQFTISLSNKGISFMELVNTKVSMEEGIK